MHRLTLKMEALRHSEVLITVNPLARHNFFFSTDVTLHQHCSETYEFRLSFCLETLTVGWMRHVATVPLHSWTVTTRHVNNGFWYLKSRQDLFFAILSPLALSALTFCQVIYRYYMNCTSPSSLSEGVLSATFPKHLQPFPNQSKLNLHCVSEFSFCTC